MRIPASLGWWRAVPGGNEWLERLPKIVADCADQWSLELSEPISAHISLVVTATLADGAHAVLKVNFPGRPSPSSSSPTRISTAATSCAHAASLGSRSTRNRSWLSASSTPRRSCATGGTNWPSTRDPSKRIRRRLDQLAAELGLDRERMRGWALAHALAWAFDGGEVDPSLVACARWFAEAA